MLAHTIDCLHFSEDGGATWLAVRCGSDWRSIGMSANGNRMFAVHTTVPWRDNDIYDGDVFTSMDGRNWRKCGETFVSPAFETRGLNVLASSADGQRVLFGAFGAAIAPVYYSTDACASWAELS